MPTRKLLLGLTLVAAVVLLAATGYAWSATGSDRAAGDGDAGASGRALFLSKGCAACHHVTDQRIIAGFGAGPDLSGLAENAALRADGQTAEDYVRTSILAPDAYVVPAYRGTWGMPELSVTPQELDAIVTFLLKGDVPDPTPGVSS